MSCSNLTDKVPPLSNNVTDITEALGSVTDDMIEEDSKSDLSDDEDDDGIYNAFIKYYSKVRQPLDWFDPAHAESEATLEDSDRLPKSDIWYTDLKNVDNIFEYLKSFQLIYRCKRTSRPCIIVRDASTDLVNLNDFISTQSYIHSILSDQYRFFDPDNFIRGFNDDTWMSRDFRIGIKHADKSLKSWQSHHLLSIGVLLLCGLIEISVFYDAVVTVLKPQNLIIEIKFEPRHYVLMVTKSKDKK